MLLMTKASCHKAYDDVCMCASAPVHATDCNWASFTHRSEQYAWFRFIADIWMNDDFYHFTTSIHSFIDLKFSKPSFFLNWTISHLKWRRKQMNLEKLKNPKMIEWKLTVAALCLFLYHNFIYIENSFSIDVLSFYLTCIHLFWLNYFFSRFWSFFCAVVSKIWNIFGEDSVSIMANIIANDECKRETDEDNITKRLNKAFESRLDLDRVSFEGFTNK